MKNSEKGSANEVMYSRKPLTFILPALRESQAAKNPFKKFVRMSTMDTISVARTLPQGIDGSYFKKFHSLTPTEQHRAKISLEKVPKPSLFVSEPLDTDPDCEDSKGTAAEETKGPQREAKEKEKSQAEEEQQQESGYELKLTKEVLHNFKELEKIGFIPIEEVSKKYVVLPETKGKLSNKTLVLDLDDTLVHTLDPSLNYSAIRIDKNEIKTAMYMDQSSSTMVSIRVIVRPNAIKFLQELSPIYEIVVSSSPVRA